MRQLPKLGLVLAVLASGVVAAWPFRHVEPHRFATDKASPKDLILRREVRLQIGPGASDPPRAVDRPSAVSEKAARPAVIRATTNAASPASEPQPPAPILSDQFRRLDDQSPGRSSAAAVVAIPGRATSSAGHQTRKVAAPARDPGPTRDEGTVMVWHRIVDGDSLPELAERYLGDRQRYRELFEFNRDVLGSPDVLPIGQKIKVPFRDPSRQP